MKYKINLGSDELRTRTIISEALKFSNTLSYGTLVDIFAKNDFSHKQGVFTNRKFAQIVANRINARGAFGGFKSHVFVNVEKIN